MTALVRTLKPVGCPQGTDARIWRQSVEKRLNDLLDRAMSLISALDCMEADCDLEETADDEPSLGWAHNGGQSFLSGTAPNLPAGDTCDLELDNADDEEGADAEPCPDTYGETVMWGDDLKSQEVLAGS
ncbi:MULTISPECIES: hypothetical protein [unclassified Mesorhizobium]|uniref:hypothetical protein n=1 Tax=unclassified Mesorhizobium TaxID=325217 RepID=UPI00333687C1